MPMPPREYSDADLARLRELRAAGLDRGQVAREMGWSLYAVRTAYERFAVADPKLWTSEELDLVRREWPSRGSRRVAAMLPGRTAGAVKQMVRKLGLRRSNHWLTAEEKEVIRDSYAVTPAAAIAERLGRPLGVVYKAADALGVEKQRRTTAQLRRSILALVRQGKTDQEAGEALGVDRNTVKLWREKAGLPTVYLAGEKLHAVREEAARKCLETAGVKSLGELRGRVYRDRIARRGWPAGVNARAMQVAECLCDFGPQTKAQLEARGCRPGALDNLHGTSYANALCRLGLAYRVPKAAKSPAGTLVDIYFPSVEALEIRQRYLRQQKEVDDGDADAEHARRAEPGPGPERGQEVRAG